LRERQSYKKIGVHIHLVLEIRIKALIRSLKHRNDKAFLRTIGLGLEILFCIQNGTAKISAITEIDNRELGYITHMEARSVMKTKRTG